jgi:hypothetical protein
LQDALTKRQQLLSHPALVQMVNKVTLCRGRGAWCCAAAAHRVIHCACRWQSFDVMTAHKPVGKKWVTYKQYVLFFEMSSRLLAPDSGLSEEELHEGLRVRGWPVLLLHGAVYAGAAGSLCVLQRNMPGPFAMRGVQSEWEKDRMGLPALTGPVFYKAVFELIGTAFLGGKAPCSASVMLTISARCGAADQWSTSVRAADYVGLAELLYSEAANLAQSGAWQTDDELFPAAPPVQGADRVRAARRRAVVVMCCGVRWAARSCSSRV